ncbi:hypothetical protein J6590_048483, partial [Homalodisca vitripennis]
MGLLSRQISGLLVKEWKVEKFVQGEVLHLVISIDFISAIKLKREVLKAHYLFGYMFLRIKGYKPVSVEVPIGTNLASDKSSALEVPKTSQVQGGI